ncbi:Alpha/Beta hydrolase protein [Hyaloraphidium curvatum]|nr:Alpha/Beta hydrolase protein [Hyaloraphidium curvatum]
MPSRLATLSLLLLAAAGAAARPARDAQIALGGAAAPLAGLAVEPAGPFERVTLAALPGYALRVMAPGALSLCDTNTTLQRTGYLDVDDDKHFFFWFFESHHQPESDPVSLWLNGGPGCSSMTGLFMELGPCRPRKGGSNTRHNRYGWNNRANMIFLDQPVNVGFSYSDSGKDVQDTPSSAKDVDAFMRLFFAKFPKYTSSDFHVFGESYAGHYIPAIGSTIVENNKKAGKDKPKINLKSLGIGNGLVDPLNQYEFYPEMACNSPDYPPSLDEETCDQMRSKVSTCKSLISACYNYQNTFSCVPASIYCNQALIGPFSNTGKNVYDVRKKCEGGNLCYPILGDIEKYLNQPQVKKALGVDPDRKFVSCNMQINQEFVMKGDWMKPFVRMLPPLLNDGLRVLIYAGDADFICNWIGNKAWTGELEWKGKDGYLAAKDLPFNNTLEEGAGEYRTFENFSFLKVFGAGHMVPYDQPLNSVEMFERWIEGVDFGAKWKSVQPPAKK